MDPDHLQMIRHQLIFPPDRNYLLALRDMSSADWHVFLIFQYSLHYFKRYLSRLVFTQGGCLLLFRLHIGGVRGTRP